MSEFQYYEFQALDRQLTKKEIAELRKCSSRARISNSRFVNHYSYGDFKGDIKKWVERYFDAFIYLANWGSRRLIFRFPKQQIDSKLVKEYCVNECMRCWSTKQHLVVEFCVDECYDQDWLDEDDNTLFTLLPLRSEISHNDYRLFYLGWLLCVQYGEVQSKFSEPPVPLGLGVLSPALEAFTYFFNLDVKLLKSAASVSTEALHEIETDDIEPVIAGLSSSEKISWLCRLALDNNPNLQAEFRQTIIPDSGIEFFSQKPRRTVAEITTTKRSKK